jgi:hypothetical protein
MATVREFIQEKKRENKNIFWIWVSYPTGGSVPLNKKMKNNYKVQYFIFTDNCPDLLSNIYIKDDSDEETEDFSTELEDYFL